MSVRDEMKRFRLASLGVAWWLAGFVMLVLAAALVLLGLNSGQMEAGGSNFTASWPSPPSWPSPSGCTRAPEA